MAQPYTNLDINKGAFGVLASGASAADTAKTVSTPGGRPMRVLSVEVTYSAAPTQTGVTVTRNSALGAAYDTLLNTGSANAQNTLYQPSEPLILAPGDALDVVAPAAGGVITSAITIYGLLL